MTPPMTPAAAPATAVTTGMTPPLLLPPPFDCAAARGVDCCLAAEVFDADVFEAPDLLVRPRPFDDGLVRFRALVLRAPLVVLRELLRFFVPELVVAISPPGLRLRSVAAAAAAQQPVRQAGSRHTGDGRRSKRLERRGL
jgi:hypothetical protein